MKISKLLVLGAMLLVGKNAWAAVDANVWQKPAFPFFPEVTEFATYKTTATLPGAVDGEELYLYNVSAHMFWTSGNNWATRASLTSADGQNNGAATSEGMKGSAIYFVPTDAATALGADVVEIKNFMHRDKKFISAFGGNAFDDIWTDNDGRDDRFWKIVDQGNGTYRLQNVLKQKELFVGWTEAYADTRLYFLAADAEGACIDWKLVSPAAYEAWYASLPENAFDQIATWRAAASIYKAAMDLKKAIDEAEELGVDVADQITVYNNTASTQEELNAAIAAANEKIEAGGKVKIIVSMEGEGVQVPNVIGATEAEATSKLEAEGFHVIKEKEYNSGIVKGNVISQSPQAGDLISRDGTVSLVISLGADKSGEMKMPNLVGMTEENARKTLEEMGLVCKKVTEVYSNTVPEGQICEQSYTVNSTILTGTEVELKLSMGPEPKYYDCDISVSQPPNYAGGSAHVILITPDSTILFDTTTDSFPVNINLNHIFMVPQGRVRITYTIYNEEEVYDADGNMSIQSVPAEDTYEYEVSFRESNG